MLVTSRYDEDDVKAHCNSMGVKIVPKSMCGFVPIEMKGKVDVQS